MARINDALAQLHVGDLQRAEALCRDALDDAAQRPDALHILGLVAHRRGEGEAALRYLKDAVRADPRNGDRRLELGLLAYDVGSHYDAVAHLEALVAGCGEVPQALACLGKALLRLGHPEMAIDRLERAVAAAPDWAQTWEDLAGAYRAAGRPMAAARALEGAFHHAPRPELLLDLGDVLMEAGRLQRAASHYRKLVRQDPKSRVGWIRLGNALRASGKRRRALKAYHSAVEAYPDDPEAQVELGRTELLTGQVEAGLARLAWRGMRSSPQAANRNDSANTVESVTIVADGSVAETLLLGGYLEQAKQIWNGVRLAVQPELLSLLEELWVDRPDIELCAPTEVDHRHPTLCLVELPARLVDATTEPRPRPALHLSSVRSGESGPPRQGSALGVLLRSPVRGEQLRRQLLAALEQQVSAGPSQLTVLPDSTDMHTLAMQLAELSVLVTDDPLATVLAASLGTPAFALFDMDQFPHVGMDGNGFYSNALRVFRDRPAAGFRNALQAIGAELAKAQHAA